ncbi:uncharacterized protein A1O5_11811 [Cladophialophora psammophila CBS 110553]|uniref:SnoaL-like domain-containing protein n=1 Tax=Cladophialophora psammophila CBS 110553 TaxID=1182543 RepID=W9W932_9EURO|nr:uncharacterized protein A1O5_11811 [Cladophialophora psammophila CBS 110553]EXJ61495.1 hypothetical protein A1O5_11811 [Cladophialophora psammophila CBS 110553]
MGYNTENTEWPTFEINSTVKELIDRFFWQLDQKDQDSGHILADKVFATTGKAEFGGHVFIGPDELRKSRDNAWKVVTKRRHEILKVFAADLDGSDLLFIGHVAIDLNNGKIVAGEFAGRLRIENATSSQPRLLLYQSWADSAPFVKALQGN